MRSNPALSGEIHEGAGGKQGKADEERTSDPGKPDATFEHEIVEDAEDQHEDGCLREERGAAPREDQQKARGGQFTRA